MKFGFIAKHRSIWPVAWLCEALGVSRSGFHAWLKPAPARARGRTKRSCQRSGRASWRATAPMAPVGSGATCWKQAFRAACTRSNV